MVSSRTKFAWWWRRSGIALRAFIFVLGFSLFTLLMYWQRPVQSSENFGSNILVFLLVNLNILVLCVLAFLVGRNVVKLIFDRRRAIVGSKLRSRLVVAFVTVALVPTVILFIVASGLLSEAVEDWFSSQIEESVGGAIKVAREYYQLVENQARAETTAIVEELNHKLDNGSKAQQLHPWLEREREKRGLFSITLYDIAKNAVVSANHPGSEIENFKEPALDPIAIGKAMRGELTAVPEDRDGSKFFRVYAPLKLNQVPAAMVVSLRSDPEMSKALQVVTDSFKEYEQLKLFKNPLKSMYLLLLGMITVMILFAAIWFAFYISRELVVPIQRLAEGTREVARGNYDFQVRVSGDDEVSLLVNSFNTMTSDLRTSRNEAESRRVFIETILANLAVGVIGIDSSGKVTAVNEAARELFELDASQDYRGGSLANVIGAIVNQHVSGMLDRLRSGSVPQAVLETELNMLRQGKEHRLLVSAGTIVDRNGKQLGQVLIFDDLTDLIKAQNIAAWREVARRIAHEIKNPLTPIQLSAQRLQKLFSDKGQDPAVLESTQTIVTNVDSIKRLANEFSNFARMPTAELAPTDLNSLVAETMAPFAETNSEITLQFIAGNKIPPALMDREQIRRVLINLLDNAIQAIRSQGTSGRITIRTEHDQARERVSLEVADTGPGISAEIKSRIFDPYFTTRNSGTGLGLAIVASVVSEHQGSIQVLDNKPKGSRFMVELPLRQQPGTIRRFVGLAPGIKP